MSVAITNARFADEAGTLVDCTIAHPILGSIPYTASAEARDTFGRQVWAALQNMGIAPYEAPAPVVPETVTKIQLVRALRGAGLWEGVSGVRAAIAAASVTIQEDWEFATILPRNDPLIAAFASALGLTGAQGDAIFIAAGAI